jgi:phage head maturation protease
VTEKIGVVCGYGALFGQLSLNLADKGEAPCFETISAGGLTLAADITLDRHHFASMMPVAATRDRTLRCAIDEAGLWFEADLFAVPGGFDVRNYLRGGRALAVSFTMVDWQTTRRGDIETVTSAKVASLSLMRPGQAAYAGTRAWLSDEIPADPTALELQQSQRRIQARSTAAIMARAPPARRGWRAHALTWHETEAAAKRLGLL